MKTVIEHMRERIEPNGRMCELNKLRQTQWSKEFEQLMRNRLVQGAFRYGRLEKQDCNSFDLLSSCIDRIKKYQKDRNQEHLVDAANLLLCEFVHPSFTDIHFSPIDDGEHVKRSFSNG